MQHHFPILFENIPEKILRWGKNYCAVENIGNWLTVKQLEQYVFRITIIYLRSMAFKFGEQNQFSYATNQDRYRRNDMILRAHETTLTTTPGAATC